MKRVPRDVCVCVNYGSLLVTHTHGRDVYFPSNHGHVHRLAKRVKFLHQPVSVWVGRVHPFRGVFQGEPLDSLEGSRQNSHAFRDEGRALLAPAPKLVHMPRQVPAFLEGALVWVILQGNQREANHLQGSPIDFRLPTESDSDREREREREGRRCVGSMRCCWRRRLSCLSSSSPIPRAKRADNTSLN